MSNLFYAIPKKLLRSAKVYKPHSQSKSDHLQTHILAKKSWAVTILAVGLVATPTPAMDAMVDTHLAAVDLAVMVVVDVAVAVETAGAHAVATAVADVAAVMPVFRVSGTVADGLELLQQNRRKTARKCSC
ncbi:hypothetical protein ACTXT7_003921 [Hymenolepis weldensis]